jgi:predicted AAA+ superfamily ATPase
MFEEKVADIYVTGSNSRMLSSEIDTTLRGRTVNIEVFPLSYKEYYQNLENKNDHQRAFLEYTKIGGFPNVVNMKRDALEIHTFLEGLYSLVFMKDIIERYAIDHPLVLRDIIKFLYSNIGSPISAKKITDTLVSKGRSVARLTVEKYLMYITDAMLCYKVDRNDLKGKGLLDTSPKYYATDIGLRNYLLGLDNTDMGHILENIVYLELRRQGYKISIGKVDDKEVDFVAIKDDTTTYIQVALTVMDPNVLQRELASLKVIKDFYPRLLLTTDYLTSSHFDGIKHMNVYEWLIQSK